MAKIQSIDNERWGRLEQQEFLFVAGGNTKWYCQFGRQLGSFYKAKHTLTIWLTHSPPWCLPKCVESSCLHKNLHTNVCSIFLLSIYFLLFSIQVFHSLVKLVLKYMHIRRIKTNYNYFLTFSEKQLSRSLKTRSTLNLQVHEHQTSNLVWLCLLSFL